MNAELKERFLNKYSGKTQQDYRLALNKCQTIEEDLGKNLYEFNREELELALSNFRSSSINQINKVITIIRKYIEFANNEGYVETKMNYGEWFSARDSKKYIDKIADENKIIPYEQLLKIEDECENKQDAVIFALLFEGVRGEGHEELVNLKKTDVNYNDKTLLLSRNDGSTRIINVSDKTLEIISLATVETEYYFNNGNGNSHVKNFNHLVDNDYVIRPCRRGSNDKNYPSDRINITSRIKRIANYFGNKFINPKNVWYSGIAYEAKKIKEAKKTIDIEDWKTISKKFGKDDYAATRESVINYL
jgi:hypothetical protein